jgi:hypothetical protein
VETVVRREQLKALVIEAMISFLEDDVYGGSEAGATFDRAAIRPLSAIPLAPYESTYKADYWWAEHCG